MNLNKLVQGESKLTSEINIAFIPLDNRPVSYVLPAQIAELNKTVKVFRPPREYVGGLYNISNIDNILSWLEETCDQNNINIIICSLDTIAYGGLVASRRSNDSDELIKGRIEKLKSILLAEKNKNNTKIYAFSSIMRISNNNCNEEEKTYWNKYGELIFRYSYMAHQKVLGVKVDEDELGSAKYAIPSKILDDYMNTRERNYTINVSYLDWVSENILDFLVFSQDDTAEYGVNVMESASMGAEIKSKSLDSKVKVETGTDEIPTDLTVKSIVDLLDEKVSIAPVLSTKNGNNIISRYENRPIYQSIIGQSLLCGVVLSDDFDNADIELLVHTPESKQNDHSMKIYDEPESKDAVTRCMNFINKSNKPVILVDIAYANGADNALVSELIKDNQKLSKLYAYAGWNTTGNALGSAISMGVSRFLAEKTGNFDTENFKKLLTTRFADDWAYQSIVRQKLKESINDRDLGLLSDKLKPFIEDLAAKLGLNIDKVDLLFPWNRSFEVEITL